MGDYKQRTGQKQRLTIACDATRELVAQAAGFVVAWDAWSEQARASRRCAAAALGLVGVGSKRWRSQWPLNPVTPLQGNRRGSSRCASLSASNPGLQRTPSWSNWIM